MVSVDVLKMKVAQLTVYYIYLKESQDVTIAEFCTDKKIRQYVERTLHLAIECCLDIGKLYNCRQWLAGTT